MPTQRLDQAQQGPCRMQRLEYEEHPKDQTCFTTLQKCNRKAFCWPTIRPPDQSRIQFSVESSCLLVLFLIETGRLKPLGLRHLAVRIFCWQDMFPSFSCLSGYALAQRASKTTCESPTEVTENWISTAASILSNLLGIATKSILTTHSINRLAKKYLEIHRT